MFILARSSSRWTHFAKSKVKLKVYLFTLSWWLFYTTQSAGRFWKHVFEYWNVDKILSWTRSSYFVFNSFNILGTVFWQSFVDNVEFCMHTKIAFRFCAVQQYLSWNQILTFTRVVLRASPRVQEKLAARAIAFAKNFVWETLCQTSLWITE